MLDLSILSAVSPPYVRDTTVKATEPFPGEDNVEPIIAKFLVINAPKPRQSGLQYTVNQLQICLSNAAGDISKCERQVYRLDQFLLINDLFESGNISSEQVDNRTEAQKERDKIEERKQTPVDIATLEQSVFSNGATGLGTLLVPFLYIRWGSTVLHNSFPSKNLDDDPGQIRQNVRGFTISYDTDTSGMESSGGSGAQGSGTSTCELTLNPHLVDGNGNNITVNTDGAELTVMWGYPNSGQVRVHTFAQTGIRDTFYNDQTTTVSFRGVEWKLSRSSEQKRYSSGDWRERVTQIAIDACTSLGYEEDDCVIKFDPEDFASGDNAFQIGETAQTGRGNTFGHLSRVVERTQGCSVIKTTDRTGKQDGQRGKFVITISCQPQLGFDDSTIPRLVDRAMWLGQGLVERVELSDAGDGTANTANSGGNCGDRNRRRRNLRVKNAVLKSFKKGCDYRLLNEGNINSPVVTGLDNEYSLKLSQLNLDDTSQTTDTDETQYIPILAPFRGKILAKGLKVNCPSTESAEDCGPDGDINRKGTGNSVTIAAEEPDNRLLENVEWTFYHLGPELQVSVGDIVDPGTIIGVQGSSGLAASPITGVNITRNGTTLTYDESQPFINDYIRTITYRCSLLQQSCLLPGYVTTDDVGIGANDHIHLQTRDLQQLIQAFDTMAAADPSTCYNLNGSGDVSNTGANKCWDAIWENTQKNAVATACVAAHSKRFGFPCDFYIFDKTDESVRLVLDDGPVDDPHGQRGRTLANPFPELNHYYSETNAAVGVRFFASDVGVPGFFSGEDGDSIGLTAQLYHGDKLNLSQLGLANQTISGCDDDETFDDIDGNQFLADNDLAALTNKQPKRDEFNWNNVGNVPEPGNTNKIYISAGHYLDAVSSGTAGPNNFSFRYTDVDGTTINRTLEGIINIRAARFFLEYGQQNGFDVELDFGKQARVEGADGFAQVAARLGSEQSNGFYSIELHCDAPSGNQGIIPPSAKFNAGVHPFDKALAREFGAWTKEYANGFAVCNNGARILELTPLSGNTINDINIVQTFTNDIQNNSFEDSDRILESWAFRFFSAIRNTSLDESAFSEDVPSSLTSFCGTEGKYSGPGATDRNMQLIQKFCEVEKCNAKDVAAFIQAESSWDLNAENPSSKCTGIFQCCPGQAPEAEMKTALASGTIPEWWPTDAGASNFETTKTYFNSCADVKGQSLEVQLQTYLAYKIGTHKSFTPVLLKDGLCLNYTQIATPALVDIVRGNYNANFKEACEVKNSEEQCRKFHSQNGWFKGTTYESAKIKQICQFAIDAAIDDPRLSGDCTFGGPLTSGSRSSQTGCRNSSVNRTLNARNEGTLTSGGLENLKFRQEIKLSAEFGVCPRNIFLAPTTSDGFPMYILLANMDNTAGFADFKIRSVQLSWQGHWRWNIVAYRPADSTTFEPPQTMTQPRSLKEWIRYYWFPSFQEDGNQFAPPGQRAEYNADGNLLNNLKGPSISNTTNVAQNIAQQIFNTVQETFAQQDPRGAIRITGNTATTLNELAEDFKASCEVFPSSCSKLIREHLKSHTTIENFVEIQSSDGGFRKLTQWAQFSMLTQLDLRGDNVRQRAEQN